MDIDSQAAEKAGNKAILEIFDGVGFAVGSENNLFAIEMKCVEGMKKFLLNVFFAGNKLDIVNKDTIKLTIFGLKLIHALGAEGGNKVIAEGFGGKVADVVLRMEAEKLVADGLHEVGFADTDTTPDKKGIVGKAGVGYYPLGSGEGKIVAVSDDKLLKSITGVEGGGGGRRSGSRE